MLVIKGQHVEPELVSEGPCCRDEQLSLGGTGSFEEQE